MWPDKRIPAAGGSRLVVAGADDSLCYWLGGSVCYHQSLNGDASYA